MRDAEQTKDRLIEQLRRELAQTKQSEERLKAFMENSPAVKWMKDARGRYVCVNRAFEKRFGVRLEDCCGKTDSDLWPPEIAEAFSENDLAVLKSSRAMDMIRDVRFPGEKRFTWYDFKFPFVDSSGNQFVCGVGLDITPQKQLEENLRESEKRYRELVQYANSAIIRWKSDGTITFFNEYAQSFFGYREDEAIGKNAGMLLPEKESNGTDLACLMQDIVRYPERHVQNINENLCRDGRRVWMAWTNRAILDRNGVVAEILAVGTDITDRKRAEDALSRTLDELEARVQQRTAELEKANQKLRAVPSKLLTAQEEEKRKLAAELHDSVSQTLAALKYGIEAVLAKRRKGFAEEAFRDLDRFVPILQRSIEETRAIYMSLKPTVLEDMGLIAALQWLKRQFQRLNPACHIELEMDISEQEIPEPLRLTIFRIVQESLNNVAKHSSAEWVDLSLSRNGRGIELTVHDDGIGMDVSYILQSNHARSIGLESMRERSELTGGVFTIESVLGEGSIIRVVWPS